MTRRRQRVWSRRKRIWLPELCPLPVPISYRTDTQSWLPDGSRSPPVGLCSPRFRLAAKPAGACEEAGVLRGGHQLQPSPLLGPTQPLPLSKGGGGLGEPPVRYRPTPLVRAIPFAARFGSWDAAVSIGSCTESGERS